MKDSRDSFSKLMQKGKLELPFSDFEENTMKIIQLELKYKSSIKRSYQISAFFFVLGTALGLFANGLIAGAQSAIMGISPKQLIFCFQLIFIFVVLIQSENIFRHFVKLRK